MHLNVLLGKKLRWLERATDYWDVATYFELHAVQREWRKASQAGLQMYLLNPPGWRFKTTINNLKIVHDARRMLNQTRSGQHARTGTTAGDDIYHFWFDFLNDAGDSHSQSLPVHELPARVPVSHFCSIQRRIDDRSELLFLRF